MTNKKEQREMFIVHIKNNKTGEIRQWIDNQDWHDGGSWMWGDGNYSCDCNRALFFARSKGEDETEAWEQPCGSVTYSVPLVELPDGTRITDVDET